MHRRLLPSFRNRRGQNRPTGAPPPSRAVQPVREMPQGRTSGKLENRPVNFHAFQEALAISTSLSLGTFAKGKAVHLILANQITPVCDCFGFTGMSILPGRRNFRVGRHRGRRTGRLGRDEHAEAHRGEHSDFNGSACPGRSPAAVAARPVQGPVPGRALRGKAGAGHTDYELVDVLPVENIKRAPISYISAR